MTSGPLPPVEEGSLRANKEDPRPARSVKSSRPSAVTDQLALFRLFFWDLLDFFPDDGEVIRCIDTDAYRSMGDTDHGYGNLVTNQDSLADFA